MKQAINVGSAPNDGTGDPLRGAMQKIEANFTDLYNKAIVEATTSTSPTAYVITPSPALTAFTNPLGFKIKIHATSTGPSTLNPSALGAKKIFKTPTTQASTGDLLINQIYLFVYDAALDSGAGGFLIVGGTGTGGGGAVDSVNGQTGIVVLDAADVGADPSGSAATVASNLSAHIADTTDAHAATAIGNTPAGNIASTTVQAALNELDSEKVDKETFTVLTDGSTVTWDTANKQNPIAKLTSTQSFTIDMTNVKNGSSGILKLITNTASAITLTFDASFTNKTLNATFTTYTFPALTAQEYFLTYIVDGTTIEWVIGDITVTYPYARLQRAANQSTTNGGTAAIAWDTENADTANIWAVGSATVINIPGSGNKRARLTGWCQWGNNGATITGYRRIFVRKNGSYSVSDGGFAQIAPQASTDVTCSFAFQIDCAGGDYLEIAAIQNSATLDITALVHITIEPRQ